jgi:hypothetical protein
MSSALFPDRGCTAPNGHARIEIATAITLPSELELEIAYRGVIHHWEVESVAATKVAAETVGTVPGRLLNASQRRLPA